METKWLSFDFMLTIDILVNFNQLQHNLSSNYHILPCLYLFCRIPQIIPQTAVHYVLHKIVVVSEL